MSKNSLLHKFIIYLLTIASVGPFAFVIAGVSGLAILAIFTYIIISQHKYKASIVLAFTAISFNFSLLIVVWLLHNLKMLIWHKIELEFSIIFVTIFFISSLGPEIIREKYHKHLTPKSLLIVAGITLLVSMLISLLRFILGIKMIIDSPYLIGFLYGITLGIAVGVAARQLILPTITLFHHISEYVKIIALPMAAFFCGYIIIFLTFAGTYALIAQHDHSAFSGKYAWSLNEFLVYSISNITTLGDTQIYANNNLTKWLSSLEVFLGVIWTTVVLAATVGYAQKDFAKLNKNK